MRAIRARYEPYEQARQRIEQLEGLGHEVDKVEFIVMGGTFMSLAEDYRDWFIRSLHDALSGHQSSNVDEAVRYVLAGNACMEQQRASLFPFLVFFLVDFPRWPRASALASRSRRGRIIVWRPI